MDQIDPTEQTEQKIKELGRLAKKSVVQYYFDEAERFVPGYRKNAVLRDRYRFIDGVTLDGTKTNDTSKPYWVRPFTDFILYIDVDVTGAPTDVLIDVQYSPDGNRWYKLMNGPFGDLRYEDAAGDKAECLEGKVLGSYMRIYAVATGGGQGATFRLTIEAEFVQL